MRTLVVLVFLLALLSAASASTLRFGAGEARLTAPAGEASVALFEDHATLSDAAGLADGTADRFDCGPGIDRFMADPLDRVIHCEAG